jgi:hypothetical protein
MTTLSNATQALQEMLQRIDSNSHEAQQHRTNSVLANIGAVLAYLLTRDARSRTVRIVGDVAAVGGILYANSQHNKVSILDYRNNLQIDSALSIIETQGLPNLRTEYNRDVIRRFFELSSGVGVHVDQVMKSQGNRLKNRSLLGKKGQQLLLNAPYVDIVRNKIRWNRIMCQIDTTKCFPDPVGEFISKVSGISVPKLQKEGLYSKIIIGTLVILGLLLVGVDSSAAFLFWAGLGFWGGNHFFPIFPQTRKLRYAVTNLIDQLQHQPPVSTLTFR